MRKYKTTQAFFVLLFLLFFSSGLRSQSLDLEMIYKYHLFYPHRPEGILSMQDGIHYTVLDQDRHVLRYSYENGQVVDTLFSLDWIENEAVPEISSYSFSEDERNILIATGEERIYRYSYRSDYYVYDLDNEVIIPVFSEGKQQLASLSPDGRKAAFVFDNNLYIKDLRTSKLTQITSDGLKNHVINGLPDWVYEEEFTLKTGYYWSPDSRKIAYYRFDESRVREFSMILYNDLYPEVSSFKYPKAGEANALVDIYVYDLVKGVSQKMESGEETDRYIPRIKWVPDSRQICITVLNRKQDQADLYLASAEDGTSRIFYTEKEDQFISEFTDDFVSFPDSGHTALILNERSGFMHLYRYDLEGTELNAVTQGNWEIDELLGIDEDRGVVYYTSTEVSPLERHIYRVNLDGTGKVQLSHKKGHHTAAFSKNFAWSIRTWSDANTPPVTSLYNEQGERIRILEDNAMIGLFVEKLNFTEKQFRTFRNPEGTELDYYQILPPHFKARKKYPLLVNVYGGPEHQAVQDKWDYELAWLEYMAQQGFVVVCLDNRGADGRGEAFKKSIYHQLGKYETEDQVAFAEFMAAKPWIDQKRIGVFGWSYGGYMSLLLLTKGSHVFTAGVAVAPVTNWKYYDTVYTERFMGKPEENEAGYEENAPINFVDQLKGDLFIVHGMEDDNVHFQNTAEFIHALNIQNKPYELYIYPKQNHHISRSRYHLYLAVDRFFRDTLK